MENFKRSVKRLITRLTVLGLVVICGAIAIAQANRDRIAANAETPDLTEPGAAFTDVGNPVKRGGQAAGLPGIEFEDSDEAPAPDFGAPVVSTADLATKLGAGASGVVKDASVQPAQALADAADAVDRFTRPFRTGNNRTAAERAPSNPVSVGSLEKRVDSSNTNRFDPPGATQPFLPETSRDSTGSTPKVAAAPEFLKDDFPPPPTNGAPTPPQGATLPEFPDSTPTLGQAPDFGQAPEFTSPESGTATPAPTEPARLTDRFGNQPPVRSATRSSEPAFARESRPNVDSAPVFDATPSTSGTPTAEGERFGATAFDNSPGRPTAVNPPESRTSFIDNGTLSESTIAPVDPGVDALSGQPPMRRSDALSDTTFGAETSHSMGHAATGKPGPRELENVQNTSLSIHKTAPKNVRVGAPATFRINVRNNSQATAERIIIRDEVPEGTQLIDTNPTAEHDSTGAVIWQIGTLPPGQNVEVSMQVQPTVEGLIGSVASVTYETLASARAEVKKPMLKVVHTTKEKALLGELVQFIITIENPGFGGLRRTWLSKRKCRRV